MNTAAVARKAWSPISQNDRTEIEEELERILASAPFRSSRRYPSLLRFVVEKTISGEADCLKERTLGVEVFHRLADYDTNADPVVRFSAGEVRRRLAQYYQEVANQRRVEISLPVGSYVPQFWRLDLPEEPAAVSPDKIELESDDPGPIMADATRAANFSSPPGSDSNLIGSFSRKSFFSGILVSIIAVAALALTASLIRFRATPQKAKTPLQEFWAPLLSNPDAVIICVGRTRVEDPDLPEPPNATIEQHILRPDARISLAAVQAVSQVAGFLDTQHKQFRISEAYSTALQDLHRRPVMLVSGYNNIWTMRLLNHLRFHLEQEGSIHYIADSQHPDRRDWSVDFAMPYLKETTDYAIIGRFYDSTTDSPVVVVAGIGSNASQGAGEFVVSPAALESLARLAPHGLLDQNFEAVLKVEVIGGNTGATTILASQFW